MGPMIDEFKQKQDKPTLAILAQAMLVQGEVGSIRDLMAGSSNAWYGGSYWKHIMRHRGILQVSHGRAAVCGVALLRHGMVTRGGIAQAVQDVMARTLQCRGMLCSNLKVAMPAARVLSGTHHQ